ncbi:MAG: hypothetical protein R3B09_23210 [Nannocystaceae bacterium]
MTRLTLITLLTPLLLPPLLLPLACTGDDGTTSEGSASSTETSTASTTDASTSASSTTASTSAGTDSSTAGTTTAGTTAGTTTDATTTTGATTDATTSSTTASTTGDPVDCDPDNLPPEGSPCATNGDSCSPGCEDPCQFCNVLQCDNGTWQGLEVFPAECLSCDDVCPHVLAAECKGGPPDQDACVAGCANNEAECTLVFHQMLACIGGMPTFTCNESQLPTVVGCEQEFDALYQCINP